VKRETEIILASSKKFFKKNREKVDNIKKPPRRRQQKTCYKIENIPKKATVNKENTVKKDRKGRQKDCRRASSKIIVKNTGNNEIKPPKLQAGLKKGQREHLSSLKEEPHKSFGASFVQNK
jgi:hypothetical protein